MGETINPAAEFIIDLAQGMITYKLVKEAIKNMPDEERLKYFDNAFDVGYIILNPEKEYEPTIILKTREKDLGMTYETIKCCYCDSQIDQKTAIDVILKVIIQHDPRLSRFTLDELKELVRKVKPSEDEQ